MNRYITFLKQEIIRHPDYKSAMKKNDIALIRLNERVTFNENIRPACLRTAISDIREGAELIIIGWGTISEKGSLVLIIK